MWNKSVEVKEEKIVKRISVQTIFISMFGFLICLCALCSTTWAWLNDNTHSGNNVIELGFFELIIFVDETEVKDNSVTIGSGLHTISLNVSNNATASRGFCRITINDKVYVTDLIETGSGEFVFSIDLKLESAEIKFETVWGIPSEPNIKNGNTYEIK